MAFIDPGPLTGRLVRLEPMGFHHLPQLVERGADERIWEWTVDRNDTPEAMRLYVERALAERDRGVVYPFVTVDLASGLVVGSTRFAGIAPEHRRLEIGWSWVAPSWQRTGINREAKYLMLRYAFDVLQYHRVEIKTDARNERSRAAIERLGAKFEGVLRRHVIRHNGVVRDTVYYSVTDLEWPDVRKHLEALLAQKAISLPIP